jgi:branched-chain amino acid transport system substrate-binding protein
MGSLRNNRNRLGLGFLLAVSLTAAACSSTPSSGGSGSGLTASAPGVTSSTITIGIDVPLSGPVASSGLGLEPAFKAVADWANANGGINGRKLKFDFVDTAYDATTAATVVKQLVQQDNVFAIDDNFGTPPVQATYQYLNEQGVPDINAYAGDPPFVNPITTDTFELFPTYATQGKVFGEYAKSAYPGAKVGTFYQDDGFGMPYAQAFSSVLGSQVVSQQSYQPTAVDFTTQIAALHAAGVSVIGCFCIFSPMSALLQYAASTNWNVHVITSFGTGDETIVGLVGAKDSNGVVSDTFFHPVTETSNPEVQLLQGIFNKYQPGHTFNDNAMIGLGGAQLLVEQLRAAGKNPTRASLLQAMTTQKFTGVWYGDVAESATNHNAWTCINLTKLVNGTLTTFGSTTCTA